MTTTVTFLKNNVFQTKYGWYDCFRCLFNFVCPSGDLITRGDCWDLIKPIELCHICLPIRCH